MAPLHDHLSIYKDPIISPRQDPIIASTRISSTNTASLSLRQKFYAPSKHHRHLKGYSYKKHRKIVNKISGELDLYIVRELYEILALLYVILLTKSKIFVIQDYTRILFFDLRWGVGKTNTVLVHTIQHADNQSTETTRKSWEEKTSGGRNDVEGEGKRADSIERL